MDVVLAASADFFGTANRAMRLEFWPDHGGVAAVPWADFPERWRRRGMQVLRAAIAKELGLDSIPRRRKGDACRTRPRRAVGQMIWSAYTARAWRTRFLCATARAWWRSGGVAMRNEVATLGRLSRGRGG